MASRANSKTPFAARTKGNGYLPVTREEAEEIRAAIEAVEEKGYGSVEVTVQDGKVLDIVTTERKRLRTK